MNHSTTADTNDIISPPLKIRLLSRPQFLFDHFSDFLKANDTSWSRDPAATDAELLLETSGRICYMSFGEKQFRKNNNAYIRNLIAQGHDSVLEHASWTLLITGISRAFTHQLVRHRVGFSFSQLSQQYHDESDAKFVPPAEIRSTPEALIAWAESMRTARQAYRNILESLPLKETDPKEKNRMLRSAARSALPNCTETKIVVSANARAIRHFLAVRGSIVGDLEMRQVSATLLELVRDEAPSLFSDFLIETHSDALPIVLMRTPAHD